MSGSPKQTLIRANEVKVTSNRAWVGPASDSHAGATEVHLEKQQGVVVAVRVVCPCGRETRLELDYADSPKS